MALNSFPSVEAGASENNRVYRATASGTYTVDVKPGVYRVTRQATTNIVLGGQTIVPSTTPSMLFLATGQTSITFNSTVSQDLVPWFTGSRQSHSSLGEAQRRVHFLKRDSVFYVSDRSNTQHGLSTNGLNWIFYTQNSANWGSQWPEEIAEGPTLYVKPSSGWPNNSNTTFSWSTNARSWSTAQVTPISGGNIMANNFVGATFGNGRYVLGGVLTGNTGCIVWSTDPTGANRWSNPITLLGNEGFSTGDFGNGVFVFGGYVGSARFSTNAESWTVANPLFGAQAIRRIVFGQGKFVAVGDTGLVSVSTNGSTWALANAGFPTTHSLRNVLFDEDEGIWAVGAHDQTSMRISTDTVTWQVRSTPSTYSEFGLAYGNNTYYMGHNVVDGNQWDPRTVSSLVGLSPSVPFTDTYIMLDFKGQIRTLT
jgi:hypothetical protein